MLEEKFNALRLARTHNLGNLGYRYLISKEGSATAAVNNFNDIVWRGRKLQLPPIEEIEKEMKFAEQNGVSFIFFGTSPYPESLNRINGPVCLSYKGRIELLQSRIIAVVGTRTPSLIGLKFCRETVHNLLKIDEQLTVISGLAEGIDREAHISSLPNTIGVLPGGIDICYPSSNALLFSEIGLRGLLISDRPYGHRPMAHLFPKRNALMAALATCVLVIECTRNSGSIITANYAKEYGKPLYVVPGHPNDLKYAGNNFLLRNGANLFISTQDILKDLQFSYLHDIVQLEFDRDIKNDDINKFLALLSSTPVHLNDFAQYWPIGILLSMAAELEIAGEVELTMDLKIRRLFQDPLIN